MNDLNEFIKESRFKLIPHNEVELSYTHLKDEGAEVVETYNSLIDKFALLSNVKSDKVLSTYMNELHIFNALIPFAQKHEGIKLLLNNLFHRWKSELTLTRASNGTERNLQSQVGRSEAITGYGSEFEKIFSKNEDNDNPYISQLFKSFKKRR